MTRGRRGRRRSLPWVAVTALPTTASPRGCAALLTPVLTSGAVAVGATLLVPGAHAAPLVTATGSAVLAVTAAALHRAGRATRPAVHAVVLLLVVTCSALVLTAPGAELAGAYTAGFGLVAMLAVATCSWAGAAAHLPLMAVVALVDRAQRDGPWSAFVIHLGVLTISCCVAGYLVRAAAVAEVDALTGLPNRRRAERHLDAAVARAGDGLDTSVAVVDLDHFKQVNDSRGHDAGDLLLVAVATALREGVQEVLGAGSDVLVARWGGDEFVVVGPHPPEVVARAVSAARSRLPEGSSCSAGVTLLHRTDTPSSALSRADAALYEVKRGVRGTTGVQLGHPA